MLDYPPHFGPEGIRIAFYGPMASGKTYLAEKLFNNYHKESLARPLKETAKLFYGVTGKTDSERQILQEFADDIKKWDEHVFTKLLLHRLNEHYAAYAMMGNHPGPVVVDDLRFQHEADDLRDYGFSIIRVSVPEVTRLERIKEKYPDTDPARFSHRSETDLNNIVPDENVLGMGEEGIKYLRTLYGIQ